MSKKSKDSNQAAEPERRTVRGASRETERRTGEVASVAVDDSSPSVSSFQGTLASNTVPVGGELQFKLPPGYEIDFGNVISIGTR